MKMFILFQLLLLLLHNIQLSEQIATMAIDLGTEFMKVAIVKPGVPMEIALNWESQRKTPTVITIKDGERLFGSAAINMGVRFPALSFQYLPKLLGKRIDHPMVREYMDRYPYYNIKEDDGGALRFVINEEVSYTVEELIAMLLEKCMEIANRFSGFPINSAVIVIPPYYGQAERRALLRAAKLIDLNTLQLMNSNAAVALNFGVFRYKQFNDTAQCYMFMDMGSSSTTVYIVSYQTKKVREAGMAVEYPEMKTLALGYDASLGALDFVLRLQQHLAREFSVLSGITLQRVTGNNRAMAKLLREAFRVMKILSANNEISAQVENVMEERDFKVKVSRSTFESLCTDLFERVGVPINEAINLAQIPLDDMKEVLLMGGATRIPRVQEILQRTLGREELGKSINTDEAAALGAVYQAAHLSPGFRVKGFTVTDANLFPIQVTFQRSENGKTVTRTLFNLMNPIPQKKAITFNKHNVDFSVDVTLGDLSHISERNRGYLSRTLARVQVEGVGAAYAKHMTHVDENDVTDKNVTSKGAKLHFIMDDSGLFHLRYADALFEKSAEAIEKEKSTITKISEGFSRLFSGKDDEPASPTKTNNVSDLPIGNTTTSNDTLNITKKVEPADKGPVVVSEGLTLTYVFLDHDNVTDEQMTKSKNLLRELKRIDKAKIDLEHSRNELEAALFDMRDKLSSDVYVKCSTEAERDSVSRVIEEVSLWYDEEDSEDVNKKAEFDKQLEKIRFAVKDIKYRVDQMVERVNAFSLLFDRLNHSNIFLQTISFNYTGPNLIFTQAEVDTLNRTIETAKTWYVEKEKLSKEMDLTRDPSFTARDIDMMTGDLEREVQYLFTKAKIWKNNPPPTPTPPSNNTTTNSTVQDDVMSNYTVNVEPPPVTMPRDTNEKDSTDDSKFNATVEEPKLEL